MSNYTTNAQSKDARAAAKSKADREAAARAKAKATARGTTTTPPTTTTNPYLQGANEPIQDYVNRINQMNQGKTPTPTPTPTGVTGYTPIPGVAGQGIPRTGTTPTTPTTTPTGTTPTGTTPTGTTPTGTGETAGAGWESKLKQAQTDYEAKMKTSQENWQSKFEETMKGLQTSQEESQKKQEGLFSKMGEEANADLMAKFQETQKTTQDAFKDYFAEQSKYLEELKTQPSAVENLKTFREEQGLPQMEKELAGIDQTILDTEELLSKIEQDIRTRTEGLPVTEAAARRLTAMEQKPLTTQMSDLIRGRQRVAAGLEAKQATVSQFMGAQEADIAKQQQLAETRLGFAGERAEFTGNLAQQSFDMASQLQDSLNTVTQMRLQSEVSSQDYKQQLAEAGFDFFTQMRAEQIAGVKEGKEFEQSLLLEQMKADLTSSSPSIKAVDDFTDSAGNVTMITTFDDGTSQVVNMGAIGKGVTTVGAEDQEEITRVTNLLTDFGTRDYVSQGYYNQVKSTADIDPSKFDDRFSHLLSHQDKVALGIEEPEDKESIVWKWLVTDEAKRLTDEQRDAEIQGYGLDPSLFFE